MTIALQIPGLPEQPSAEDLLLETLADIAYLAGARGFHSGDSRADVVTMIEWAREFERGHYPQDDYMTAVHDFAKRKLDEAGNCKR